MSTVARPSAGRPGRRARGALKADLVTLLTRADQPLSARELRAAVGGTPAPSTTSVLTVLERLRAAGVVGRDLGPDRELRFWLVRIESPRAAEAMLEDLLRSADRTGALQHFAGRLEAGDVAVLQRLLDRKAAPTSALATEEPG